MTEPKAAAPAAATLKQSGACPGPVQGRVKKRYPAPRIRRQRLEDSGLPRMERGKRHATVTGQPTREGQEWTDYLLGVCARVGLERPCPRWALDPLKECGKQHLLLLEVEAQHQAEKAKAQPSEATLRRLWSLLSRQRGRKRTYENVLRAAVQEHRAQARAQVPGVEALLATVGRRG